MALERPIHAIRIFVWMIVIMALVTGGLCAATGYWPGFWLAVFCVAYYPVVYLLAPVLWASWRGRGQA